LGIRSGDDDDGDDDGDVDGDDVSDRPPPPPPPHSEPASSGFFGPPTGPPVTQSGPRLRKVSGLGSAIVILTSIAGVSSLLSGITQGSARADARRFLDQAITEEEFLASYTSATGAGAVASAAQIAVAVLTFILMFKMARNLRDLDRGTTWSPIWGIAGWFLPPGVLYVIPWLMLRELWKASGKDPDWRSNPGSVPISFTVWWVFFGLIPIGLATILGVSVVNAGLMATDTRALATILAERYLVTLASSIVTAIAAIAYVMVVRGLVARHRLLTGEISSLG
jgi:hypothetical protein